MDMNEPPPEPATPATEVPLQWNDEAMVTHFANVVNIHSTREQFDILFGTNRTWDPVSAAPITVDLSARILMSPFAVKRLWLALGSVVTEYERRHGTLNLGAS